MNNEELILNIGAGIILLLAGRRLFWLFVGIMGFLFGLEFTRSFAFGQSEYVNLIFALVIGGIGAVLAIFMQKVAIGFAGFLAGGYILDAWWQQLLAVPSELPWLPFVIGGIIGLLVAVVLFRWALIGLSSLVGATLIADSLGLQSQLSMIVLGVLFVIGIVVQAGMAKSDEPAAEKR